MAALLFAVKSDTLKYLPWINLCIFMVLNIYFFIQCSEASDAPVVAPFMFPPALKEGERGSAICTIKSGDRPLDFKWLKDGSEIQESQNVKIQSVMDSSFLVIEAVTSQSSGNYTCIVKNTFGSDHFTATLMVSAPPKWVIQPFDIQTQEGKTESVPCKATGVPSPKIKWKFGEQMETEISEDSNQMVYVSKNGSLVLNKVDSSMKGSYTCVADNNFGAPLKKIIFISVSGKLDR
ncbi:Down syndrome cell adhesion molecule-like protein Dscam2 [Stegodyphus dumicola]|uniref:Down syndrome cell adhesion molecule-like protein Dscam2 n=1 Tax=Stegodyphus dumicola TaxID=202533 RepID=UPI0015A82F70|nr:Down syndrome cell adhesion molecule-like protein Dscam2 [Stegodyphus dumicola]